MASAREQFDGTDKNLEPFLKKPTPAGFAAAQRLKEFEGNPNRIVTKVNFQVLSNRYERTRNNAEDGINSAINAKKLLEELRDKYHFPIPLVDVIVGADEKLKPCAYVLTEKIDGNPITELLSRRNGYLKSGQDRQNIIGELDLAFARFTEYVREKYTAKDLCLWDMGSPDQFVWGRKQGENSPHLYAVDMEIHFVTRDRESIFDAFLQALDAILDIEKKYGIAFSHTREKIETFVKFFEQEGDQYYAGRLRKRLERESEEE